MNDKEFDILIKKLQDKIDEEEKKDYSKKVIEEYKNPSNFGFIKNPDASKKIKGSCGDTVQIDLKINSNKISEVRFWTDGCGASIACGSKLTKMIKGKTIEEAEKISSKDLLESLDGLPEENVHCAVLSVNTLRECIKKYYEKR